MQCPQAALRCINSCADRKFRGCVKNIEVRAMRAVTR